MRFAALADSPPPDRANARSSIAGLIAAAPTAYALNRTMPDSGAPAFIATSIKAEAVSGAHAAGQPMPLVADARKVVGDALRDKEVNRPDVYAGLSVLSHGAISKIPAAATPNLRNDMYLANEALRVLLKEGGKFSGDENKVLKSYSSSLQASTRFIPIWVKVCVAIALGLGAMIGWKRIVVTVGEKIGKTHLTYAQGAAAELVAAGAILAADFYAVPVSTTHILSSGLAGTMAANGSGL